VVVLTNLMRESLVVTMTQLGILGVTNSIPVTFLPLLNLPVLLRH